MYPRVGGWVTTGSANGRLLGAWVSAGIRRGLSPKSLGKRLATMEALARYIGPRNLLEARHEDIEGWLATRVQTPGTRRWHLANLSSFYVWAVRERWLDINPTARIERPRNRRYLPRPIAEADLRLALGAADARMRVWLMLGAFQGLRVSEMAALRREAVLDTQRPALLLIEYGKGGHQRVLPLNDGVATTLRDYGMARSGWLFPSTKGDGHITSETVTKYLSAFFRELGIDATAHQLRHRFASEIYRLTHDLRLTQELLGHANPNTTAVYTAWSPGEAAVAVRNLAV